jgi:APA family basic amino acid/polyamine antiporter
MGAPSRPTELRRVLTVFLGAAIVVGGTIGAGILRTPGIVAQETGHPILFLAAWIAGGVLALMGASCFAELSAALPKAGGPYVYTRRAFGPFAGFVTGWADWVTNTFALAFLAVATGEYAVALAPTLAGFENAVGVGALAALALLNWFGLKLGGRVQEVLSLAKVVGLVAVALGCLFIAPADAAMPAAHLWAAPLVFGALPLIHAMQVVSETYAGWNSSVYFAEEDSNAARNGPRALFGGVIAITVTYVLINAALVMVLPFDVLAASKLPVADAARLVFGGASDRIITALVLVSLVGIINVYIMLNPRIVFAMSRDGVLPEQGSRLNHAASPGIGIIVSAVPAAILAAGFSFEILFLITGFLGVAVNAAAYLAHFQLRRTEPDLPRPYRAWGHPWLPALVTLISIALLAGFIAANPEPSLYAVAAIAASYPVYLWLRRQPRGTA